VTITVIDGDDFQSLEKNNAVLHQPFSSDIASRKKQHCKLQKPNT